jgi:carboxymethylenebutenolidase
VREKTVSIPTADGQMETFVVHPEESGPFAPVIIYMDVWGLRPELCNIARKVAVVGYYVLLPDLYYRQGRIRHEWRDADGRMISLPKLDSARQAEVLAPARHLSNATVVADSAALLDFIGRGEPVRHGAVGSIGYCMGGQFVIRAAAAYPERFLANAYLHGGQLVTDREDSPHRLVRRLRGELYCGFAEKDPQATPSIRAALDEAIAECPVEYQAVVHPPRSRHPRQARRQPRLGADFRNVPAPALDTVVDELTPYFTHEPADPIRRERENSRRLPHSMTGKGHLRP